MPSEKDINKCLKNACLDEIISVGDLERVLVSRGCLCLVDSDRDCRLRELV